MFKLKMIKKPILFKLKCDFTFPPIVLANMQEKEAIPTKEQQEIVPDKNYDGLSKVTVNPIPDEYIIPDGNLEINQNGTYDVNNYSSAEVNVPEKVLGTKTITSNGTYNAVDDNLDGYSQVSVETSGVDINDYFETNSTQVSSYENVGCWYRLVKKLPSIKHTGQSKYYLFRRFQGEELDTLNFTFPGETNLESMCYMCYNLKKINMSNMISENISNCYATFSNCLKLETIIFPDDIGTKFGATNIAQMFRKCTNLTTLPLINASNVINIYWLFRDAKNITNLGGFRNLGEAYLTTQSANYKDYTLDLTPCSLLTEQSIINVLNNLYDIASKGCNTQSVILGSTNLAKLTSEEGQQALTQAQNYGWTIS